MWNSLSKEVHKKRICLDFSYRSVHYLLLGWKQIKEEIFEEVLTFDAFKEIVLREDLRMGENLNQEKKAVVDVLNGVVGHEYYVYALCEKTNDGKLVPFYIGKGKGERVWAHEMEQKKRS